MESKKWFEKHKQLPMQGYIELLQTEFKEQLHKVIVFGSYARGDFGEFSDVDVMILLSTSEAVAKQIEMRIDDLTCDYNVENDIMIMPFVCSIGYYEKNIDIIPLFENINREGVVLYKAIGILRGKR